jgi:hypothetical protein
MQAKMRSYLFQGIAVDNVRLPDKKEFQGQHL